MSIILDDNGMMKALPAGPTEKPLENQDVKGASRKPPKEYSDGGATGKADYADPNNWKYPIDTEKHVRSAMSYFSQPANHGMYSDGERKTIAGRIASAAKNFGIEVSDDWKEKFNLKKAESPIDQGIYGMKALIKAKGKKDIHKLIRVRRADKNGVVRTVYIKPEDLKKNDSQKKEGVLSVLAAVFGKSRAEVKKQIASDYSAIKPEFPDVTIDVFANHIAEYFTNQEKWEKKFAGSEKAKTEKVPDEKGVSADQGEGDGEDKPVKEKPAREKKESAGSKWNDALMQAIHMMYGGGDAQDEAPANKAGFPAWQMNLAKAVDFGRG